MCQPDYPPPKKKPNLVLWASLGCASVFLCLAFGGLWTLVLVRRWLDRKPPAQVTTTSEPATSEPEKRPEPKPAWSEDPAVRRAGHMWGNPFDSGRDMGCKRMTCREYSDLHPWSDATWAKAREDGARRIVLNSGPAAFCDWNVWAPDADIQLWKYDGQFVYLLRGGSFDGVYFVSKSLSTGCQVILMTRTWPAHRDD